MDPTRKPTETDLEPNLILNIFFDVYVKFISLKAYAIFNYFFQKQDYLHLSVIFYCSHLKLQFLYNICVYLYLSEMRA